jgi:hypothetical protein
MVAWMSMTSITTSARHWQATRRVLFVNAPEKVFGVWLEGRVIKSVPIKGLAGREMGWEDYVAFIKKQARSEERRLRGFAAQEAPALAFASEFPSCYHPGAIS